MRPPSQKKATVSVVLVALVFATSALASRESATWTATDMKTAIRGLGYPKPHPRKLSCKSSGDLSFRCVATYRHHRRSRFVAMSVAGAWLCAGKTTSSCNPLRHGFVTNAQLARNYQGQLATAALFAARDYMDIHYGIAAPITAPGGGQTGPTTWAYVYYTSDTTTVTITISFKAAKGGYAVTGSG